MTENRPAPTLAQLEGALRKTGYVGPFNLAALQKAITIKTKRVPNMRWDEEHGKWIGFKSGIGPGWYMSKEPLAVAAWLLINA